MVNAQTAWRLILQNAQKAMQVNMVYKTLVREHSYRIINVAPNSITIQRLDGIQNQELEEATVVRAVNTLNAHNGKKQRRTLISPTVAEETTFVLFHPQLAWTEDGTFIIDIEEHPQV